MSFERIEGFLLEYRKKLFAQEDKRVLLRNVIKEISGVSISEENFTLKKGEIFIKANPAVKNEIFLYKEKIIEEFKIRGENSISDIR